jgi:hypothetical protein
MITEREARLSAEVWVREEVKNVPEVVGAILAGSTRGRDPAAPHPAGSDVDIFIFVNAEVPNDTVEPRGRFAPRKLGYRGVVLEPSFHAAARIADPEEVLGDMSLAPAFTEPLIVADPSGRLRSLSASVGPEFRRRRHVQRRLAQAVKGVVAFGPRPCAPALPALRAPCWRNVALAIGLVRAANVPLVAALRYPTTRRAFVAAREVLAVGRHEDLADTLLRLLGSADLSRAAVEELVAELERAYDVAVEVRRTPVVADWNVSREVRELERAGIRELLDGYHREALYQVMLLRTVVQGILENDGDEEVRAWSGAGYRRLLAALGIDGDEAFYARAEALQAFVPELRAGCEELLARAPGVFD